MQPKSSHASRMLLGHAEREEMHADMVGTYLSHPEAFPVLEVLAPTCQGPLEGPGGAQFAGLPLLVDQVHCSDCCPRAPGEHKQCSSHRSALIC